MTNRLKLINGRIITPYRMIEHGSVLIENQIITAVEPGEILTKNTPVLDVEGRYISPGFIDIHTHGAGGHDFMDGTLEAFLGATAMHARHGTTTLVPTTLTSNPEELQHTLSVFREASARNVMGSHMLGLHLEGPYFSMNQCGAQDPRFIHHPDPKEYGSILRKSKASISRWSAAPELPGALEFGRMMVKNGILPSIAHTDATYEEVIRAFENGFTHVTHLYSAMSGVTRRNAFRFAGVIESAFLIDEMTVEIIADGIHLPPPLLQLIYKTKGAGRIALVTDSMRAAGMPAGMSILGSLKSGQPVIVEDEVAKLPDRTSFAGSVATAEKLVRNMVQLAGVSLVDAVRMMTTTPAGIHQLSHERGALVAGKQADIVVFDEHFDVHATLIQGRIVYSK